MKPISVFILLMLPTSGVLFAAEPGPSSSKRPNILLIITDQQQAALLSCAGNPLLKTPNLDRLAATGARFPLAYCANPVCVPSRFAMLTGAMPSRVGIETNEDMPGKRVPSEIMAHTMGRLFSKAGYETLYGGKLHTPMTLEEMDFKKMPGGEAPKLAEAAVAFLHQPHDRPFLMVNSFINPHDICFMAISDAKRPGKITGPQPLLDALKMPEGVSKEDFYAKVCPPLPANFAIPEGEPQAILDADTRAFRTYARAKWTDEQWRLHRWAYARLTELVDQQIGQVLAALHETKLDDNTVVVFVSDHGDMDASHHLEHKSVLYDEAARVPFIVSWKGITKPGLVDNEHLVSTGLDLIPTLCDFAGIEMPTALKGRSVRALAEGRSVPWRDTIVSENGSSRMLRSAKYKYVVYKSGARREMLVDMIADPGELHNLALNPAFAPVVEEHRRLLKEWYQQNGETLNAKYIASGKAD